ncbi:MAG: hypothetical protein EOO88_58185 [Pedobacter sp.]|nr:MAG: hypothetical protein EOO88_58185 [Pedobacter sp.]
MQRLPDSYMFSQHTRQTLTAWAKQLQFFYFIRAWGGHANDDDTFQAGILYENRSDLEYKLQKLGIVPGSIGPNDPQLIPGQSYRGDELANFKVPVYSYPEAWIHRCEEGIRSNIGTVLEAIMYHNPYPAKYLPESSWNQLVLKAFFTEKDVTKIIGISERKNRSLSETLKDYVEERQAAHRTVHPEIYKLIEL